MPELAPDRASAPAEPASPVGDHEERPPSLRRAASRAMLWTGIGKYSNALVSLGVTAVLTRLLTPADFGLIAMVVVISGFMTILAEAGLSTAVVQKRDLDADALSSVFWFGLGLGVLAAVLLTGSAPVVAWFFADPRLIPVVALMSLGFVFIAVGRVPLGLLERDFQFRAIAVADIGSAALGGVVGIALALGGAGYYALVAQTLVSALANALLRLSFSRFRPRRVFDRALVRSVTAYSGGVTAFSAINYWARNLDKALIGRFLGAVELGYYGRAYALMLIPLDTINGIVNPTLHPLLSALQHDRAKMAETYLRMAKLVAIVALPAMCLLGSLAPELVRTIWGPQWGPSVQVFSILCLVGSVQPVGATFGPVFLATERTRLLAISGLINACIIMAGIAIGVRHGIEGVAIGYSCAYAVIFFPTMYVVVVVLLGARVVDMLFVLAAPLGVALAVLTALYGYNSLLRGRWGDVFHVIGGIALALLVWVVLFGVLERRLFADALALVRKKK